MRAEFYRADQPDRPVGTAVWTPGGVQVEADQDGARAILGRIFRATPVAVEDAALRTAGTSGPVVLQPRGLLWFRAAAQTRGQAEGFSVRIVPEPREAMGWDPAGAYRTFSQAVLRRAVIGRVPPDGRPEAGEVRPEGLRGPAQTGTEAARPAPPPSAAGRGDSSAS